jgi:hypothetical protein
MRAAGAYALVPLVGGSRETDGVLVSDAGKSRQCVHSTRIEPV